jgi:uncharacterized repeat protein (TIGR01451 family)
MKGHRLFCLALLVLLLAAPAAQAYPRPGQPPQRNALLHHSIAALLLRVARDPPKIVQHPGFHAPPGLENPLTHSASTLPPWQINRAPPPGLLDPNLIESVGPAQSNLEPSYKEVDLDHAAPGDTLAYTVHIINSGDATSAYLWDPIPWVADFVPGSEWASSGTISFNPVDGTIEWLGDVPAGGEVQAGFEVVLSHLAAAGQPIINTAWIYDYGPGIWHERPTTTIGETPFTGYDNTGKTLVDTCDSWECEWFECATVCDEVT